MAARNLGGAPASMIAAHSWSASPETSSTRAPNPSGCCQRIRAPTTGSSTSADSARSARFDIRRLARAADLLAGAAEPALAPAEGLERLVELGLAERRPVGVGEVELGVGRLPEQEVRQPLLARRPDQQIQLRQPAGLQRRRQLLLGDLLGGDLAAG